MRLQRYHPQWYRDHTPTTDDPQSPLGVFRDVRQSGGVKFEPMRSLRAVLRVIRSTTVVGRPHRIHVTVCKISPAPSVLSRNIPVGRGGRVLVGAPADAHFVWFQFQPRPVSDDVSSLPQEEGEVGENTDERDAQSVERGDTQKRPLCVHPHQN